MYKHEDLFIIIHSGLRLAWIFMKERVNFVLLGVVILILKRVVLQEKIRFWKKSYSLEGKQLLGVS